jgi:enamine deaminase RidA (YjgF/YER057c/UK114 family)
MSLVEAKLAELGLTLPAPPTPVATYVPYVRTGNLVFLSGHGPMRDGKPIFVGKVGIDLSLQQGQEAARLTMLNLLATLKSAIGELDRVNRVVKLLGMVNCAPDFGQQPEVINGASDLLVTLYGERGRHARSAVGMGALPRGIPVEIEMIVEVE